MLNPELPYFFVFFLMCLLDPFFWLLCSFLVPQLCSCSPSQTPCDETFLLLLPVTGDQVVSTHPQVKAARCVCLVEILQQQSPLIQAKDTHNTIKNINVLKHCENNGLSIRRAVSVFQEKPLVMIWTGQTPSIWSFQSDEEARKHGWQVTAICNFSASNFHLPTS